ncbi:MAG: hypothetical protein Q8P59_13845, partial [Dehalococcoidia bacterium]|nr:hypothetical protein [Dehalococcoidia bacterium]
PHVDRSAEEATHSPEGAQGIKVDPTYVKLLERHWDRLREQAVALHAQLSPLDIATLFAAEACQKACDAFQSGSPLPLGHLWSRVFDAPVELRSSGSAEDRGIEARLSVEVEFLFPHLVSHLEAEFGEFTQFRAYKEQLGRLILACLQRAESVSRSCCLSSGMYYLDRDRERGLSRQFPAFICHYILGNSGSGIKPRLCIEPHPGGLYKLVAEEWPAIILAVDTTDHISRCQEVLLKQIKDNTRLQVWRQIYTDLADLKTMASQLQAMLTTVIERGSFTGTCSLCEGYFIQTSQSA